MVFAQRKYLEYVTDNKRSYSNKVGLCPRRCSATPAYSARGRRDGWREEVEALPRVSVTINLDLGERHTEEDLIPKIPNPFNAQKLRSRPIGRGIHRRSVLKV